MGRNSWANEDQTAWLEERRKPFKDAQAENRTAEFFAATSEAFLVKWPMEDTEAAEKRATQIKWWLINRGRESQKGKKNGVLVLQKRRRQPLHVYQAYMRLFSERVMPEIQKRYTEYLATVANEPGVQAQGKWAFTIAEASRMYAQEPEDVQAQVEAFRKQNYQDQTSTVLTIEELVRSGIDAAQKAVRGLQNSIDCLAKTGHSALEAIHTQTGWNGTLLLGGPHPESGQLVTMAIHYGRTAVLGNIFADSTEHWPMLQGAFEGFVAACYPPELPSQLEQILRGQLPDIELPTEEEAPEPGPSHTTSSSDSDQPDGLQYERDRFAQIARNKAFLAALNSNTPLSDLFSSTSRAGKRLPAWIKDAKSYFESVSEDAAWKNLVDSWIELEGVLGYPDGQVQRNWLNAKGRPEEVKWWTGRGRKYDKEPSITSVDKYAAVLQKWWARLQPGCRRTEGTSWPLHRNTPSDPDSWASIMRGGCNGIFTVVICLAWWLRDLVEHQSDTADVFAMIADVTWACRAMIATKTKPTAADSTGSEHTPSAAPLSESVPPPAPTLLEPAPSQPASNPSDQPAQPAPNPSDQPAQPASTSSDQPAQPASTSSDQSAQPASTSSDQSAQVGSTATISDPGSTTTSPPGSVSAGPQPVSTSSAQVGSTAPISANLTTTSAGPVSAGPQPASTSSAQVGSATPTTATPTTTSLVPPHTASDPSAGGAASAAQPMSTSSIPAPSMQPTTPPAHQLRSGEPAPTSTASEGLVQTSSIPSVMMAVPPTSPPAPSDTQPASIAAAPASTVSSSDLAALAPSTELAPTTLARTASTQSVQSGACPPSTLNDSAMAMEDGSDWVVVGNMGQGDVEMVDNSVDAVLVGKVSTRQLRSSAKRSAPVDDRGAVVKKTKTGL